MKGRLRTARRVNAVVAMGQVSTQAIHALGILPDGSVVCCSEDGVLRLLSTDLEVLRELGGHQGPTNCIAVFDDGFVTGGDDGTARIWGFDGVQRAVCRGHGAYVRSVAVGPGVVATACEDHVVRIFSLQGELLHEALRHEQPVHAVAVVDGVVYSSSPDNTIRRQGLDGEAMEPVYDAGAMVVGEARWFLVVGNNEGPGHRKGGPDQLLDVEGRLVSVAEEVIWWSGEHVQHTLHTGWGGSDAVAVGTDVYVAAHGEVLWTRDGVLRGRYPTPKRGASAVAVRGDAIYVGGRDGEVWKLDRRQPLELGHVQFVTAVECAPGAVRAATTDSSGRVTLWKHGQPVAMAAVSPQPNRAGMAWDLQGESLAVVASDPPRLEVFAGDGKRQRVVFMEEQSGALSVCALPDGWAVGFGGAGMALVGEELTYCEGHTKQISQLMWLKSDEVAAVAYFGDDPATPLAAVPRLQVWSRASAELLWSVAATVPEGENYAPGFGTLQWFAPGLFVALSGRHGGEVVLWSADGSFQPLAMFEGHAAPYVESGRIWIAVEAGLNHYAVEVDRHGKELARVVLPGGVRWLGPLLGIALCHVDEQMVVVSLESGDTIDQLDLGVPIGRVTSVGSRLLLALANGEVLTYRLPSA